MKEKIKESKADKMFEKIKFLKVKNDNKEVIYKEIDGERKIFFDLVDKTCHVEDGYMTIAMHEAMYEKTKELGWM